MKTNIASLALILTAAGCAHRGSYHATTLPSPPSLPPTVALAQVCMRPSGLCTELVHGLHCALMPVDAREVWSGRWSATAIPPSDYQTQELRNLVRAGWWFTRPSTLPDGRIVGSVVVMKPID